MTSTTRPITNSRILCQLNLATHKIFSLVMISVFRHQGYHVRSDNLRCEALYPASISTSLRILRRGPYTYVNRHPYCFMAQYPYLFHQYTPSSLCLLSTRSCLEQVAKRTLLAHRYRCGLYSDICRNTSIS